MADDIDIANDLAERLRQAALARHQPLETGALSAEFCEDCDGPIPPLRRQAAPGCQTCVPCKELRERRR